MSHKYRHSTLGEFHKFDQTKATVSTVLVPDAALAGLVQYLNEGEESEDHKRVLKILRLMLEVENIEQPVWNERFEGPLRVSRQGRYVVNPALKKIALAKYEAQFQIDHKEELINREFAHYRFSPRIGCWTKKWWNVTWLIRAKAPAKRTTHRGIMSMDDGAVLQLMLDLARAGYLGRLRRCACCNEWLYAKFRHQDYCSTKCQQEHYRKSEEWRSKRRLYMRNYRNRDMKLDKTSHS